MLPTQLNASLSLSAITMVGQSSLSMRQKTLFFPSEMAVDSWCKQYGHPKGAILSIGTGMKLAKLWFGDFAAPNWRQKSAIDANATFEELGLDLKFWKVANAR